MQRFGPELLTLLGTCLGRAGALLALLSIVAVPAGAAGGPKLVRLTVAPAQVNLDAADARQHLVVTGEYSDGLARDVTRQARFTCGNLKIARVAGNGIVAPVSDGATVVAVAVPGASAPAARVAVQVTRATVPRMPTFTQHVLPIFNKYGCASGSCHGSFAGKNGFRVSLFGHDPQIDYLYLVRQGAGRRVNRVEPSRSLVLRKPTLQMPHTGGKRFEIGSPAYNTLARWIAAGARWDPAEPTVTRVEVFPSERILRRGQEQQILVTARFSDGHSEDITDVAKYGSNDDGVATVNDAGVIHAEQVGDAAITVTFLGEIVPVRVLVPVSGLQVFRSSGVQGDGRRDAVSVVGGPGDRPRSFAPPASVVVGPSSPEHPNTRTPEHPPYIDRLVFAKLNKLGITPSPACSDVEFLRRVSLDLCGMTPAPDEIRAFVADRDPEKRGKKIDELMGREQYAEYWATYLSDLTGNDNRLTAPLPREKASHRWQAWFYARMKENASWADIARGVIAATSREGRPASEWLASAQKDQANRDLRTADGWDASEYMKRKTLDLYWMKAGNGNATAATQQISYAFLGVKLECAQCHKHPFDRWTQADYQNFSAFFARLKNGLSPETNKELAEKGMKPGTEREIFCDVTAKAPVPRALDRNPVTIASDQDPREALVDWMTRPENPFFARAIVNRIWAHHLGRGLVDPPDAFSAANPPSNPELLDALAQDFVDHHFDLRYLHRTILNSQTYQLSWQSNATNARDERNFSRYIVKRLPAEVLLDAVNQATGAEEQWGNFAPPGARAIAVGPSRVTGNAGYFLSTFGRPTRTQSCDCERGQVPGLSQALFLINDDQIQKKLSAPKGRLDQLVTPDRPNGALIEDVYLWALARFPTPIERSRAARHLAAAPTRRQGCEDLMWALLNSREFLTNH